MGHLSASGICAVFKIIAESKIFSNTSLSNGKALQRFHAFTALQRLKENLRLSSLAMFEKFFLKISPFELKHHFLKV